MRLVIADDRLTIEGIRRALDGAEGIDIVGETYSGEDVIPLLERVRPDMLLLDIRMPGLDGMSTIEVIRRHYPEMTIVVLSVLKDSEHVQAAFNRGASGFIAKSVDPVDLPGALRQAVAGNVHYAPRAVVEKAASPDHGLTDREHAILCAVARGLSNQSIARELWVSEQTVKFHLHNVYRKLAVRNRTEAARYAFEHGLASAALDQHSAV